MREQTFKNFENNMFKKGKKAIQRLTTDLYPMRQIRPFLPDLLNICKECKHGSIWPSINSNGNTIR